MNLKKFQDLKQDLWPCSKIPRDSPANILASHSSSLKKNVQNERENSVNEVMNGQKKTKRYKNFKGRSCNMVLAFLSSTWNIAIT